MNKLETGEFYGNHYQKLTFKNYRNLENVPEKNSYGYLWRHNSYQINEKKVKSIEARGTGGQYIFVIPRLNGCCYYFWKL